ncbi:MAG: hypothetical protein LBV62_02415 [Rickettsiales bacterium]|jgi:hypothetical protein|nr:hypothetical protein [Rickettsiales bacterium]
MAEGKEKNNQHKKFMGSEIDYFSAYLQHSSLSKGKENDKKTQEINLQGLSTKLTKVEAIRSKASQRTI